jgi:ribosome-associated protein
MKPPPPEDKHPDPGGPFGPLSGIPEREEPRPAHTSDELKLVHRHAMFAAAVASGLKAEDIRILDVHGLVSYTDFLVICTGRSARQTRRIVEEIDVRLKRELGVTPTHVAGQSAGAPTEGGEWVVLDYLDFVVHVQTPDARDFYRLDVLWKDAPTEVIE